MAEETEKRFDAIMKKLSHSPSTPRTNSYGASGPGAQQLSGRKRPHSSSLVRKLGGNESGSSLSISPASAQATVCRPWDRGDLFRRLSTFKSITWFAKPQVVSPLECARRGWVNVDTDTIACVSCNTRLLFSTPSAWGKQQVEKAAMVFSLKLESGHNLLCPWSNNSCTAELAKFPILSRESLIEDYKRRFLSISQLIALPIISAMAVNDLRTSQLEQFLNESSNLGSHEPLESSGTESSILYYQAQKLISLFGWEPRTLPYRVDFKDGKPDSFKDANITITTGQKPKDNVQPSHEGTDPSSEMQVDPSSVVLDCKLCGASVGLWAFSTIPRPLEFIRFVGPTEVTGKNIGSSASTSLGFTIAGGPPPALLNYNATISLPMVGHNLRTRLPIKAGNEDHSEVQRPSQVEGQLLLQQSENVSAEGTIVTTEPNVISNNPLEVPESVAAEGSHSNLELTETVNGVNLAASGEASSLTPEDSTSNRSSGAIVPHIDQMSGNNTPGIGAQSHKLMPFNTRENKEPLSLDKQMEFNPIKQHRHFCPWIMSTGKSAPGWQQTLSALEADKQLSIASSSTLIQVDDPVESVRNLFASPEKKRAKVGSGS